MGEIISYGLYPIGLEVCTGLLTAVHLVFFHNIIYKYIYNNIYYATIT